VDPARRRPLIALAAATVVAALVAVGALAACDPGSPPATTTTSRPATTTTTTTSTAGGCARPGLATTVAYRTIAGVDPNALSLDIAAPKGACRAPVVLWVHGGAYQIGDKANQVAAKRALFNGKGWIFVSINYRLTTPGSPTSARFPDHYEDVAAAVAWVHRSIGAYGGDPDRLALLGHSAGADIVANVADQPRYLAAVGLTPRSIDCVGPLDTEGFDKVTSVGDGESVQWETALGNNPDYLTETSATRFITGDDSLPPTIGVVRGAPDRRAIEQAYLAKVASTGARTVTIDAAGLSHEDVNTRIGAPGDTVMTPPLVAFLDECFTAPRAQPDDGQG
jgi:acetyl esterase/lipase